MNLGTPPTAPNARTGEFTPPGVTSRARANKDSLRVVTKQSYQCGLLRQVQLGRGGRRISGSDNKNQYEKITTASVYILHQNY
jgi:hypothetical protein